MTDTDRDSKDETETEVRAVDFDVEHDRKITIALKTRRRAAEESTADYYYSDIEDQKVVTEAVTVTATEETVAEIAMAVVVVRTVYSVVKVAAAVAAVVYDEDRYSIETQKAADVAVQNETENAAAAQAGVVDSVAEEG